jgi:diadenosine tetraphosphate (Ap4A) HIT family hydrolase
MFHDGRSALRPQVTAPYLPDRRSQDNAGSGNLARWKTSRGASAAMWCTGGGTVPGGLIHCTRHWHVDHCVGPLGVGTLIVKPSRHVVHVADLTDEEAKELGPVLRDVARVTSAITHPEQVYVALWSHAGGLPGHIHYVVHPITRETMQEFGHGSGVQPAMFVANRIPDPEAVKAFANDAREIFRASRP